MTQAGRSFENAMPFIISVGNYRTISVPRKRGVTVSWCALGRRVREGTYGRTRDDRYEGAMALSDLKVRRAICKWIRAETGSQWTVFQKRGCAGPRSGECIFENLWYVRRSTISDELADDADVTEFSCRYSHRGFLSCLLLFVVVYRWCCCCRCWFYKYCTFFQKFAQWMKQQGLLDNNVKFAFVTYDDWLMKDVWVSHKGRVSISWEGRVSISWRTCEYLMKDVWVSHEKDVWVSHEWRASISWRTCEYLMKGVWVSHEGRVSISWRTCEYLMKDVWVSHGGRVSISWRTCEYLMAMK